MPKQLSHEIRNPEFTLLPPPPAICDVIQSWSEVVIRRSNMYGSNMCDEIPVHQIGNVYLCFFKSMCG